MFFPFFYQFLTFITGRYSTDKSFFSDTLIALLSYTLFSTKVFFYSEQRYIYITVLTIKSSNGISRPKPKPTIDFLDSEKNIISLEYIYIRIDKTVNIINGSAKTGRCLY